MPVRVVVVHSLCTRPGSTIEGLGRAAQKAAPTATQLCFRHRKVIGVAPTLHIRLLGDFSLVYGDTPAMDNTAARLHSLLAYLALHRDAPQQRQHLAFLFWPDSAEAQARNSLRQMLHLLRRALPDANRFLYANTTTLQWRLDAPFRLDVADFERALAVSDDAERAANWTAMRSALEQATNLYRGDLLPSCYDEWIAPERERLRAQYLQALERLISLLERQRDYTAAIEYAQCLLRHDPLREDTHLCLMRLYALHNDRASALRIYHACAEVLQHELGVEPSPATREIYERLMRTGAQQVSTTWSLPMSDALSPLIGRQHEWEQLQTAWHYATSRRSHFAIVTGEAGIGKSRLAEELLVWAHQQGIITAQARAYAAEGRLSYAPVADWLRSEDLRAACSQLAPVWLIEVARLLPELLTEQPNLPHPEPLTEYWQRQRFFEALARSVHQARQPVLLLIDDLQWCDSETLEWLHYLLRFDLRARLLVIGTARSEEVGVEHPLTTLLLALRTGGHVTEVALGPLDAAETAKLAASVVGRELDMNLAMRLYQETEGNPLFVVETVRAGLAIGDRESVNEDGAWNEPRPQMRPSRLLPLKVYAVIAVRLAQLTQPARELARLAATIGRAFSFDVLAQASESSEDSLVRALDELCQRYIVREQGGYTYDFSHDRIREVAYAELSTAHRRLLHRRVAQALETIYASDLDPVSGQVAAHYAEAGLLEQAIAYYEHAAAVAQRVYANEEAISLLNKALALLGALPGAEERDTRELTLQIALGVSLIAVRGYGASEVIEAYNRAWTLCQRLGRSPGPSVLGGRARAFLARSEIQRAYESGEQLLEIAGQSHDSLLYVEAHYVLGVGLFWLGKFARARQHLEQVVAQYDPSQHLAHTVMYGQDPGVVSRIRLALDLWYLGYPAQAVQRSQEALELAQELAHPLSLAYALNFAAWLSIDRRDVQTAREQADAMMALSKEQGLVFWPPTATIFQGWVLAQQGDVATGIAQMRQGISAYQVTGEQLHLPYALVLLAQAYGQAGAIEQGLGTLGEALSMMEETGQRFYEAELYRLRGELLRVQGVDELEIEQFFRQALEIARRQEAKSLELRAVMSLARLWQSQARGTEARQMLMEIYSWFSEGFDTPDLRDACVLLEQL
jgi:DNA-binding SARP family transcriptional activator/predicted ATPase